MISLYRVEGSVKPPSTHIKLNQEVLFMYAVSLVSDMYGYLKKAKEAYNIPICDDVLAIKHIKALMAIYEANKETLEIFPEASAIYKAALQLLGDIYFDQDKKELALECVRKFYDNKVLI